MRHSCRIIVAALLVAALLTASNEVSAQEDILGLASQLTAKSPELQKVRDDLMNQREEIKEEENAVEKDKQQVQRLRAAAQGNAPIAGPFRLYRGAASNTADLKGGGAGQSYDDLATAVAMGRRHRADRTKTQPSYRIEDRFGNVIESGGVVRNRRLTAAQIASSKNPKPADNAALNAAAKALADRQAALEKKKQEYRTAKAAYDRDLATYNSAVDRLNESLPAAIKEIGTPTPTPDQLSAPKGDYQVEDLAALATEYKGKAVKDGAAASFVQEVAKLPAPSKWGKGTKVLGAKIRPGTPIATFSKEGKHVPGKGSHTAIYITQNKKGIWVYDQYKNSAGKQRPVSTRFIHSRKETRSPSNDAGAYWIIKKGVVAPDLPPPRKK